MLAVINKYSPRGFFCSIIISYHNILVVGVRSWCYHTTLQTEALYQETESGKLKSGQPRWPLLMRSWSNIADESVIMITITDWSLSASDVKSDNHITLMRVGWDINISLAFNIFPANDVLCKAIQCHWSQQSWYQQHCHYYGLLWWIISFKLSC